MTSAPPFAPMQPLLSGSADPRCCAVVAIPARDEEAVLGRCLQALAGQVDAQGNRLELRCFEVLLLLNNCADRSAAVARAFQAAHPELALHVLERHLPPEQAHVGTARRWLMDTAWHRLQAASAATRCLLSTDADTMVAPDWIAQNLQALGNGADVVGGWVDLVRDEFAALPAALQGCYRQDRRYAALVAELEDRLDPQPGDAWPRHLDHFGSSLACTPEAYAAAGGLPAVTPLEDEAFIDSVRRAGLRLRHEPAVRVYTSARLAGRAPVGMAGQLRLWHNMDGPRAQEVPSAAFLQHRFRTLRRLREIFRTKQVGDLPLPTRWWAETFARALAEQTSCPEFLAAVYCDILIQESFAGPATEPVTEAIASLGAMVAQLLASS